MFTLKTNTCTKKKQKQEEKQKIKENDHVNLLSKAYPYFLKKKLKW